VFRVIPASNWFCNRSLLSAANIEARNIINMNEFIQYPSAEPPELTTLSRASLHNQPVYDPLASWYDEIVRTGNVVQMIAHHTLERLIKPVQGMQVLDAACGQGVVSRMLSNIGGTVTGIDVSAELISLAEGYELQSKSGIVYASGDLCDPTVTTPFLGSFDAVACNMALTDVRDLTAFLEYLIRVLKPGGKAAFTLLHPCFHATSTSWHTDSMGNKGRVIYNYFREGFWRAKNPSGMRYQTGSFHRTVSTYVNTLLTVGFEIRRVIELPFEGERSAQDPPYEKLPSVLGLLVTRPKHSSSEGK
jgi:ubiquinone/menaquinone biosynthesis C-methylase UbiE